MHKYKKIILLTLLVFTLGAGGFFLLNQNSNAPATPASTEQNKDQSDGKNNLQDKQQTIENQKPQPADSKKTVKPTITYAGQYGSNIEVGAYVSEVFEDGGSCTLTLQKEDQKVTAVVTAIKNVNAVDCPVMSIARSSVKSGEWQATVTYSSVSAEGSSETHTLGVK